jgi:hypothetical protein
VILKKINKLDKYELYSNWEGRSLDNGVILIILTMSFEINTKNLKKKERGIDGD